MRSTTKWIFQRGKGFDCRVKEWHKHLGFKNKRKKNSNCTKSWIEKIQMVLGEDIVLGHVIELQEVGLVGNMFGQFVLEILLIEWMEKVWWPISYIQEFFILALWVVDIHL